jgi:hypothetical protein
VASNIKFDNDVLLNGVIRDGLAMWVRTNNLDSLKKDIIFVNSQNSVFDSQIKRTHIENKIKDEISFFDEDYFKKRNDTCIFTLYISGHGQNGGILCDGVAYPYESLITKILELTQ